VKGSTATRRLFFIFDFNQPLRPVAEPALFRDQAEDRHDRMLQGFSGACALLPMGILDAKLRMSKIEIVSRHGGWF
jgi:hypothetical protein